MISFLKKHTLGVIIFVIFIILVVALLLFVRSIFLSGNEGTLYGNRLNGISEVKLNEDTLKKIDTDIKQNENVKEVSHRLEGKVLNVMIDVTGETTLESSKKLVDPILNSLTEQEKGFYDIQVFLTCKENEASELYPIIGYKHRTSADFSW